MAPFTISQHHPLLYDCGLPQKGLSMQSKMSPELSSGSPGDPRGRTSIVKIRVCMWQLVQRVVDFCTGVTQLLRSKMKFFFICVGKTMTMSEMKKSGAEVFERPGGEISEGASERKDPEMKVILESADDERELSSIDSNEEEDDDEARLSEWESDEETEEEDSEWSDEDDEDDDEGDSAESRELWESFLNSGDPYNPLSFCSSISSRTNTKQKQQTLAPAATRSEESTPNPQTNSKEGRKKVCFSDQVTVRPLLVWSFASRAARDGSCWMQMARDRERFRRRAESIETLLKPCLTAEHRAAVWERLQRKTSP
ncbi:protein phosphatase 1 regulatory subunit 15A-like [Carassius carassius]|uniref:protein phosphatase 1 regulatory subunit 15A-like n=1 Tax=Carassius carassius TaxID=217509 RepID=UPI0028690C06|nr:protein phosphatase 1 regulatory subunit 15A-like [Carassius carassius]